MIDINETTLGLLVVAVVITFLSSRRSTPDLPPSRQTSQAIVSPTRKEGETAVYRSKYAANALTASAYPDVATQYDAFKRGLGISRDDPCMGQRINDGPFVWETYAQVSEKFHKLGAAFVHLGADPGQETFVGLYSINRPEWVIAEYACYSQNMVTVPLYDTLGPNAARYIVQKTEMRFVVASEQQLASLFKLKPECPSLEVCIKMSAVTNAEREEAQRLGLRVLSIDEAYKLGEEHPADPVLPKSTDLATISFTSGTTGDPKGVMLTHGNLIANSSAVTSAWPTEVLPTKDDSYLSYLTLAHMLERLVHTFIYSTGARVGFYRGEISKLFDDVLELRPTYFVSVPRLWNRLYERVMSTVEQSSWLKRTLFNYALASKKADLRRGILRNDTMWDRIVFKSIRSRLGGRVKAMVTGAAPISDEVMDFLRVAFGCQVFEGYGQTEACAAIAVTLSYDYTTQHVGPPLPCVEVKLVDVPEMEYHATDINPRGEVCVRGNSVTKGYFKDPERTKEAIDEDGWLHTGDIAMINPNGTLRLIDRKKNIFKLSNGEYCAPEKIEDAIEKSTLVAQAFVHGESTEPFLVAIIVPEESVAVEWAKSNGVSESIPELYQDPSFKKAVLASLTAVCKERKLISYEIPKAIHLEHEQFTVENDLLTQSFKLRRFQARKAYREQLAALYAELGKQP